MNNLEFYDLIIDEDEPGLESFRESYEKTLCDGVHAVIVSRNARELLVGNTKLFDEEDNLLGDVDAHFVLRQNAILGCLLPYHSYLCPSGVTDWNRCIKDGTRVVYEAAYLWNVELNPLKKMDKCLSTFASRSKEQCFVIIVFFGRNPRTDLWKDEGPMEFLNRENTAFVWFDGPILYQWVYQQKGRTKSPCERHWSNWMSDFQRANEQIASFRKPKPLLSVAPESAENESCDEQATRTQPSSSPTPASTAECKPSSSSPSLSSVSSSAASSSEAEQGEEEEMEKCNKDERQDEKEELSAMRAEISSMKVAIEALKAAMESMLAERQK